MPKGIRRCLSLALLAVVALAGLFVAGCATVQGTSKNGSNKHKVLLVVKHFLFWKKIHANPDHFVILNYGDGQTEHVVTWHYVHTSTTITFEEESVIGKPSCSDDAGQCTLTLKGPLLKPDEKRHKFKYTLTGKDGEKPVDPNDPDVEIDR